MDDSERWLMEWHDRSAGATRRSFARAIPSSYEKLASFAHTDERVLDLACGDATLLEMLLQRGVAAAVGIDLSVGELRAARERLAGKATVVRAQAQALPFADESFDLVTCHFAFMLLSAIDTVAAEVRRILRKHGRFAAVISCGAGSESDAWGRLIERLKLFPYVGPRIGDKRTRSEQDRKSVV